MFEEVHQESRFRSSAQADELDSLAHVERVLHYLDKGLTCRLPVPGKVFALCIYNETADGIRYELQPADDISNQGDACTDDICRAIVLACDVFRETGSARAARLARAWSSFLRHVELRDRPGVYAPFVYGDGRLNIGGFNSRPPSKWAQGNVARAWSRLWQTFGDTHAEHQFWRVYRKDTPDLKAVANRVDGDLTAYEAAVASADPRATQQLRPRITRDVERILANREPKGYFADFRRGAEPQRLTGTVQLWGYHQLMAVARATRLLHRSDWIQPCIDTVETLIDPLLETTWPSLPYAWPVDEHGHPQAWPDAPPRWTGTAYHVSSLVAGLTELYLTTSDKAYAQRALHIAEWLHGANPTGESMYHPQFGGCYDGILDGWINRNMGAESSIEAGRAELYRFQCEVKAPSSLLSRRFGLADSTLPALQRDSKPGA
ncbi:MAG TPA: hypothetical protein VF898_03180 [Chloroflexota bacterium]